MWQRQKELARGPLLLENTVAQEVGVLKGEHGALHLPVLADGQGIDRGRQAEEGTEMGSITEMGVTAN